MELAEKYSGEAPTPEAPTYEAAFAYFFNEMRRRSFNSTDALRDEDLSVDPGHGSWSIGEILKHQLHLLRFMAETLEEGASTTVEKTDIGTRDGWNLQAMIAERELLWDHLADVFARATPISMMGKRQGLPPERWADWPVFMRFMRPLIDYATHIGQVNYARRQLGKPVARV